MLLRWPKSACNLCRISPCKEQKEKLTVFMVRQITPRCCPTPATTSQGLFHTVLSLLPHSQLCSLPHVQCHRLPPNFRAHLSQPQLWSTVYLWWVHHLPLMSPPTFHTALQSTLSQSHEQPYSSTLPTLECILSIFPLQSRHNSLQSSPPYLPKFYLQQVCLPVIPLPEQQLGARILGVVYCWHFFEVHDS